MTTAVAVVVAFLSSLATPFALRPLLQRMGVIDIPNERSSHTRPVIRGVGLAPLLALVVGYSVLLASEPADLGLLLVLLVVSVAAGGLGLIEDTRGLPVKVRAFVQLVIGLGGASAIIVLTEGPWWLVPLLATAVAAYINAANFMDGINGISGLHGTVAGGALALIGGILGLPWLVAAGLLLGVTFAAFLPWNLLRGGMFLGDVGSYLLGGGIAIIAVAALASGVPVLAVLGSLAIYLADSGVTLARRIARGERWFEAHRSHTYQRLCDLRLSHLQVAAIVTAATAATSAAGLLSLAGPMAGATGALVMVLVIAAYFSTPRLAALRFGADARDDSSGLVDSALPVQAANVRSQRWAVVGASGFIGSALVTELAVRGLEVVSIAAPRLLLDPSSAPGAVVSESDRQHEQLESLQRRLAGVGVVVNAAGLAAPDSAAGAPLFGANALLPVVIARAAQAAGAVRFVHLSSAAVQGRCDALDESAVTRPFSPYSRSKALGEAALLTYLRAFDTPNSPEVVIVRATSVQGQDRATTVQLRRVARSPIASVAGTGNRPTVVSSVRRLAEFVAEVGAHRYSVPTIVLQPWEGLTTSKVLELAGGRAPRMLPLAFCRAVLAVGFAVGSVVPSLRGVVRRVELMWMGQAQNAAWARSAGFSETETVHVADVLRGSGVEASRL